MGSAINQQNAVVPSISFNETANTIYDQGIWFTTAKYEKLE